QSTLEVVGEGTPGPSPKLTAFMVSDSGSPLQPCITPSNKTARVGHMESGRARRCPVMASSFERPNLGVPSLIENVSLSGRLQRRHYGRQRGHRLDMTGHALSQPTRFQAPIRCHGARGNAAIAASHWLTSRANWSAAPEV